MSEAARQLTEKEREVEALEGMLDATDRVIGIMPEEHAAGLREKQAEIRGMVGVMRMIADLEANGQLSEDPPENAAPAPTKVAPEGKPLTDEAWREYSWVVGLDRQGGTLMTTLRITDPVALWVGETTHRVLDSEGIVHCVPTVGRFGCVLHWKPRPGTAPVAF